MAVQIGTSMPAAVADGIGVNTSRKSKAANVIALTKARPIVGFDAVPKGPYVATERAAGTGNARPAVFRGIKNGC